MSVLYGSEQRICGLIKKYLTFLSFKQEGTWGWEWGVCDLGPPSACMTFLPPAEIAQSLAISQNLLLWVLCVSC
jgi:hypothetical protein